MSLSDILSTAQKSESTEGARVCLLVCVRQTDRHRQTEMGEIQRGRDRTERQRETEKQRSV